MRTPISKSQNARRGSVLIMVMWIIFGVVAVTLYFANSMSLELRAADNRVAGEEAEQAIEGARRYITCVLSNVNSAGVLPNPQTYANEAVPVGNAHFWIIGRNSGVQSDLSVTSPAFGLVDEASKINVNSAPSNILANLPRMTADLVNNIIAWRSTNTSSTSGGAESINYTQLPDPYSAKNAPFETVDELRLIFGMDYQTLYGEDANLNGILDPNENDGDAQPPSDNLDGQLNPGLMEYCTVYTTEPTTTSNGTPRVNLSNLATNSNGQTQLIAALTTNGISASRANTLVSTAGNRTFNTTLDFYYASGMTTAEFAQVETALRGRTIAGLVNVNTASLAVLNCIPGWTNGQSSQIVAYRTANTNNLYTTGVSLIWITQVLNKQDVLAAAPYITGHTYQFCADIAAVGHNGRGYRRTRFIFDTTQGVPIILHRQELGNLGWALGKDVRHKWLLAKQ